MATRSVSSASTRSALPSYNEAPAENLPTYDNLTEPEAAFLRDQQNALLGTKPIPPRQEPAQLEAQQDRVPTAPAQAERRDFIHRHFLDLTFFDGLTRYSCIYYISCFLGFFVFMFNIYSGERQLEPNSCPKSLTKAPFTRPLCLTIVWSASWSIVWITMIIDALYGCCSRRRRRATEWTTWAVTKRVLWWAIWWLPPIAVWSGLAIGFTFSQC